MKLKYLETYDYSKLKEYCSIRCINIVYEQQSLDYNSKGELRGMYKGYLYGLKLFNALLQRKKTIMNFLYNGYLI